MVRESISVALAAAMLLGGGAAMAQQAPVVVPGLPTDLGSAAAAAQEALAWSLAEQQGSAAAYRTYLQSFPNGANAAAARARLGQLNAGMTTPLTGTAPVVVPNPATGTTTTTVPVTPVTPARDLPAGTSPADAARAEVANATATTPAPATGSATGSAAEPALSREARRAIQARLTQLGYDTRGVDGVFGSGTRRAIANWQSAQGASATGYLTAAQADDLRTGAPAATGTASSPAAAEAALGLSAGDRRAIQSRLTQLGFDTRGVDGVFGSGTRRAISDWQRSNGATPTGYLSLRDLQGLNTHDPNPVVAADQAPSQAEAALNLSRADRLAVQRTLTQAGYDTNGVDGAFGSGTRRAIRAWQVAQGQVATGYLTSAQLATLRGAAPVVVTESGAGAADEVRLNLGSVERTEVQTRLSALGYDPRGIDGRFGPGSRAAIRSWQGDNGFAATGYLNAEQLARLRGQRRN